jgi:hypothetical protein
VRPASTTRWELVAAALPVLLAAAVYFPINCLGVYALIAVGRYYVDPQWLAIQTRYHYVGTVPIVVLACLVLGHLGREAPLQAVPPEAYLLAALALGIYGWARSDFHIDAHGASRAYFIRVLQGLDAEVASHPAGATVFLQNGKPSPALLGPVLVGVPRLFPGVRRRSCSPMTATSSTGAGSASSRAIAR